MSHDDFDFEPQPGLPAPLPPGERLLWQGRPDWWQLAVRAYHVRKVAGYFLVLVNLRIGFGVSAHEAAWNVALGAGWIALLGGLAAGILAALAYLSARQAIYSITSARVLIRHGVAVPLTLNVPFAQIAAADLRTYRADQGDILIRVAENTRVGYLINWPYVRPGHFARPQPDLRALGAVQDAAQILGGALQAHVGGPRLRLVDTPRADPVTASAA